MESQPKYFSAVHLYNPSFLRTASSESEMLKVSCTRNIIKEVTVEDCLV